MARGDIQVGINYEGTEEGAEQLDGLLGRLDATATAQTETARTATVLGRASANTARTAGHNAREQDRLRAALSSQVLGWGTLGTAVGQVGAVLGRVAPQFSGFGAVVGQAGQSIGLVATALASPNPASITSALISVAATIVDGVAAFRDYQRAASDTERSVDSMAGRARAAVASIDALTGSMRAARQLRAQASRIELGVGSAAEQAASVVQSQKEERRVRGELLILQGQQNRRIREAGGLLVDERAQIDATREALEARGRVARETSDERRALARRSRAEEVTAMERALAASAAAEAERNRARGGGGGGDREAAAAERAARAAALRETTRQRNLDAKTVAAKDEEIALERRTADELIEIAEETARQREQIQRRELDARARNTERVIEQEREMRQQALEERRAENAEIAATLTQITGAVMGAFEAAIEGEKSLEDAMVEATKMLLKQFGIEMVAKGIGAIIEGISMLPNPTAAPKLAGGAAMLAFGVSLGAAGAAIPTAGGAGVEAPREDPGGGDRGGPQTLVLNVNNPVMSAATHAQLSRGLKRQIAADRTVGPRIGDR